MEWKSYGNEDIEDAARGLRKQGYDIVVDKMPFDNHILDDDKAFLKRISFFLLTISLWFLKPVMRRASNMQPGFTTILP